ncbi:hypothetical protein [Kitasatospora camelliae]|uniref:Uncharacterized protein n=1 Tax=Kitasatospora camelliae TaxID=3156397 RepID=A0AAU8K4D4_9ACTN
MTYGVHPRTPHIRANVELARDCGACRGWGTVITDEGRHELCAVCQSPLPSEGLAAPRPAGEV